MQWRAPIVACWLAAALAACEAAHDQVRERAELRYEVRASAGGEELAIEASFRGPRGETLITQPASAQYIHDVEVSRDGGWVPLAGGPSLTLPAGEAIRLRYRFELGTCARDLDQLESACAREGALLASPSVWLLRPEMLPDDADVHWTVTCPPGTEFVSGVNLASAATPDTYVASVAHLGDLPYSAFGPFERHRVERATGTIEVAIPRQELALPDEEILHWVEEAAHALECYFGRLPIARVMIIAVPVAGDEVDFGTTIGGGGATVILFTGRQMRHVGLDRDWVLMHELVHLALPSMPRANLWLAEGIATYVEPLARTRAGALDPERMWLDLVRGLPQGLPAKGDQGLDRTWTWGRTYWGGALFCLVADLEIRERTGNRASLDDALRAIVAAGGNISESWPIEHVLSTGDAATGTHVLTELYQKMGEAPASTDLASIWQRLGITPRRGGLRFDDTAPLAAIRRAMVTPCAN